MDVCFIRAVALSGFDRYIPILTNEESTRYQELKRYTEEVSYELSATPDEELWSYFLGYYNLKSLVSSEGDNWYKTYELKPSVKMDLPPKITIIWGSSPQTVRFLPEIEDDILSSKPISGRNKEYLFIGEGSFEFNRGTTFDSDWIQVNL